MKRVNLDILYYSLYVSIDLFIYHGEILLKNEIKGRVTSLNKKRKIITLVFLGIYTERSRLDHLSFRPLFYAEFFPLIISSSKRYELETNV